MYSLLELQKCCKKYYLPATLGFDTAENEPCEAPEELLSALAGRLRGVDHRPRPVPGRDEDRPAPLLPAQDLPIGNIFLDLQNQFFSSFTR